MLSADDEKVEFFTELNEAFLLIEEEGEIRKDD